MIRKIVSTAFREYKATALTKGFIFATFVLPVLMWAVLGGLAVLGLFDAKPSPIVGSIGVIDRTQGDVVLSRLEERFDPERIAAEYEQDIENAMAAIREQAPGGELPMGEAQLRQAAETAVGPVPEVAIEALPDETEAESRKPDLASGELIAVIVVDEATIEESPGQYTLLKSQGVKARVSNKIENAVERSVIEERFVRADLDLARVDELRRAPSTVDVTVSKTGETTEAGNIIEFVIPIAAVMISIIAIFTGAGYLLTSLVEEKSSRVMEVLLSAISPMQLMTGKLLGQGLVGLTTFLVYSALGIFAAIQFEVLQFISPWTLTLLVAYFLIGYFMYAALFAAVGSAVSDMREAQALQGPLFGVMFLFIYAGMFAAINDPNNMLSRVLGLVPLSTPFVMPMRVANPAVEIAAWEVWASLALGVATVVALIWLAAKIFRVGVLMYGKPPSLLGLFKWIRYA
jgi:ABC-2 type transport system permease protein